VETLTRITKNFLCLILLVVLSTTSSQDSHARGIKRGNIIRDSEIEATLHAFATPLFKAAGLDPGKMHLYLIFDPELNAFATTSYSIFMNTGLIIKARNASEVIGVLAHEIGHIAGGHLMRREEMMKKATAIAIASAILGGAAMVAGGGDAGAGILTGGMTAADNMMMHYNRGQEASADQAAVRFLEKLHWPTQGLQTFMQTLASQELLGASQQDPYARSHPLSQDRVSFLQHAASLSLNNHLPSGFDSSFGRMVVKLKAFTQSPMQTLLEYPSSDNRPEARLARAVAYFLSAQTSQALELVQTLTKEFPQDPYYWDLQGQISFESGDIPQAVKAYARAVSLVPKDALFHVLYAQSLLEENDKWAPKAQKHLETSLTLESENPFAWRLLAVAYGRQQKTGMAALCLAEEAWVIGQYKIAYQQSKRALKTLTQSQERLRAQDIQNMAKRALSENGSRDLDGLDAS
jgi:predicted Zn-dependent protease